ncbi:dubious [Schizosaccharomyces pombe]|uniref:Putative uncharacterized protein SPAC110.05 n=1 Tax=Schizosaccharomyces pombe (strain 972 / ATCC 24843) TaxID=284812 RepID=YK35_SCHPO|nr:RecName: Full=Putative uncharacterized protein SPAC110.05; Flags: Precursor [Schizosaccharomyces pombe 972h-]
MRFLFFLPPSFITSFLYLALYSFPVPYCII